MPAPGFARKFRVLPVVLCLAAAFGVATLSSAEEDPGTTVLAQAPDVAPDPGAPEADPPASAKPPAGVEVIRIKGRGVSAIDTDVPQSVTQFDSAAIEALGAQNVQDLAKVTPNVEIRTSNATTPTFFIRGVGLNDFSSSASGSVAIYRDGVAINAPAIQLGLLYDVENVEVLRGPQGTGDARNASAGVIKIAARKPVGDYSARLRIGVGRWQSNLARDGLLQDYEGALEVPLAEEMLSTRLAFRFTARDPYATNGCGGGFTPPQSRFAPGPPGFDANPLCGERVFTDVIPNPETGDLQRVSAVPDGLPFALNDLGDWAARGTLRFQPPELEMDWLLTIQGERLDQLSTLGQAMGTGTVGSDNFNLGGSTFPRSYQEPDNLEMRQAQNAGATTIEEIQAGNTAVAQELANNLDIRPYRMDVDRVGKTTRDSWGASLRGDWNLDATNATTLELASVTGYDWYDRFRDADTDFTPVVLFETVQSDDAWQVFQSLALRGELADTPLRWEVGGLFLRENLGLASTTFIIGDSLDRPRQREYVQDIWSANAWAKASWDFLDDFTLEGGVRWNWERRDIDVNFILTGISTPNSNSQIFSAPTGGLAFRYRFAENVTGYWSYNRGWKSGSYNSGRNFVPDGKTPFARPEVIDAFETGLKGSWLEGRLSAQGSLFYYGYDDYQVFRVSTANGGLPEIEVINANDAEVYGAEIEIRAEPLAGWAYGWLDGLVVSGNFGWLASQFLDFEDAVNRSSSIGGPPVQTITQVNLSGNQLINSPRFKGSMSTEWTFDMGRWGSLIPRYDFSWSDTIYFDPNEGRGTRREDGTFALPKNTIAQRPFWLHNARLTYRSPTGNVEFSLWIRNFMDKVYKTYAFDLIEVQQVVLNFTGQPRSAGLDFTVSF
jgi:outer membrane receptor protein involved in Fe transport